jgi:sensor histidine kinase YesM
MTPDNLSYSRRIPWLALLAAWLPTFFLWYTFLSSYARMDSDMAAKVALLVVVLTAALSVPVWLFTARLPWPLGVRGWFVVRHLLAAGIYASLFVLALYLFYPGRKIGIWRALEQSNQLPLQLFTALILYGMTAGLCYAVQTRRSLHERELHAARAESLATAARLEALRARLQPHFLFNALHTVAALVREDPPRAEAAVVQLGDLLRYALDEHTGDLVPVKEEWEFTREYLAFERVRFQDRLHIESGMSEQALECMLPPFAIQTLVENAVRHAIGIRPEGGTIRIRGEVSDGRLRIEVSDDGPEGVADPAEQHHQYGIAALRERLRGAFGADAELSSGRDAAGYTVSINAPAREGHS